MSSLTNQLSSLAAASSGKQSKAKDAKSLLFLNGEGADLDIDSFFNIGQNGLAGLIAIAPNQNFEFFKDNLFADALKNQDRMLLQKDDAQNLDRIIARFLANVSPHLLHGSAFKALEWLIKRFRIHEFNIDAFIRAALPFHDTWQFTRILGTIKLSGRWSWFSAQKEKKVSLDRTTLVDRMKIDLALTEFVCDSIEKLLVPHTSNASLCSFFTGTMVEFLSSVKLDDGLMRILLPCLFAMAALDSVGNVQAASYMIMSHLSNQVPLGAPVIGAMTDVIFEHATSELAKFAACCLISVYDTQENCPKISEESLERLLSESSFWMPVLADALAVYQGDALTVTIIASFFQLRKQNVGKATYTEFVEFLNGLNLTASLAEKLCSFILEDALLTPPSTPEDTVAIKKLLVLIAKSFPLVVNSSIASISKNAKQKAGSQQVFDLVSSAFVGTAHEPLRESNTTLYLSLQHADEEIRFLGYDRLVKIIVSQNLSASNTSLESSDFAFIPEALTSGLTDSSLKIRNLVANNVGNLVDFLLLVPDMKGIKALFSVADVTRKSNRSLFRSVFQHLLKLEATNVEARNYALSYFVLAKETVGAFVYATSIVAAASKQQGCVLGSLFGGTDALAKELQQAEKIHKGKGADYEKVLDDVYGRSLALIAANAVKHESALNILVSNLSSSNAVARILSISVLSKIAESPQYVEQLSAVSKALLGHLKANLNVTALGESTSSSFPTALPSLHHSKLKPLEDGLVLASLSLIVSQLPRLRKQDVSVQPIDYHNSIERDVFEVLMKARKVTSVHKVIGSLFEGHLKGNTLQFLINLSLDSQTCESTQAQSLRLVGVALNAELEAKLEGRDYQVLVPVLLVALSRTSKVVREQAVRVLKAIKQIQGSIVGGSAAGKKITASIFAFDSFYGVSSNKVKFLLPDLTNKFVGALLETSQELISDSSYIYRRLADILFSKKNPILDSTQSENAVTFLLTTVLALPSASTKYEVLNTLKSVPVPQKVKILQPLFDIVFGNGEAVNTCKSPQELNLRIAMIDCFGKESSIATVFGYRSGRFLSLFLRIISTTNEDREAIHALSLVDKEWFSAATAFHEAIFTCLVHIASKSSKDVALAAKKAIKVVEVGASVILTVISACKAAIGDSDDTEQRSKRSRIDTESVSGVNELITVLELLDATSNITNRSELIGPLFELLGFVLPLDGARVPVSLEYLKQLLITAKLSIIRNLKEVGTVVDESIIRVDLIVSCIRVSDNPQTHNEALLLLAELADVYPNTVLLNVVPIFTFMGANVLRRDDDYSFHVIQQTLEAIVPPLIKKSKSSAKKLDVKSIIEVFIDSIFHIPQHRRLRLFTILVSTLGPVEFLDSVIMMLLLKSSQRFSDVAMANPSDIASLSVFCLNLVHQFDTLVQVKTVVAITEAIQILPKDSSAPNEKLIGSVQLDVRGFASNEVKHFKLICLDFSNNVLEALVSGLQQPKKVSSDSAVEQDALFHTIFQTTLVIIVDTLGTKSLQQAAESKNTYFRSLSKRLNSILSHLNQLMSFSSFFELALSLLKHEDISIRVRVTDLTKEKLQEVNEKTYKKNSDLIHSVFTTLVAAIGEGESTENISLKLSSFDCVHLMLDKFSASEPQVFAAVLSVLTADDVLDSESRQIRLASLECIGSCISNLGPRLIPFIKKIMSSVFDILKTLGENLAVDQLCVVALGCADLFVSVMPQFLSPFVSDILESMFLPYDKLTGGKEVLNKFRNTKRDIASNISKKIPIRTLIPILIKHVTPCFKLGAAATLELFEVSSMTISNMEKGDLTVFTNYLVKFFLSSFEFRKKYHILYSESDIDKVEGAIISAFLQLVLRLNESLFKPMFFKIVDWAFNTSGGNTTEGVAENILFLYRLVVNLLEKLKTIFSPYVLHLVDHSIDLLSAYKGSEADKRWDLIMQALNKFLLYSSGPVTEEVFNKLTKCLTGQIDLVAVHGANYLTQMTRHVVPTIGLLAVNIAKEPMWKILNKEVMKKSRNDNVLCRIVTVKALQEFYVHLGEEFLILLPETVPTIAELMEDGDERVQIACQELSAEIQKHLGEDLNSYFA
ncbi:UNVERIFIED_CONTAM: HEAT repeat-containing protein 1 [Siphonaria sp. JEL0065]|nr:HEAT repeat-containing protein 1 [Siphonaria sp. JEL0065]